MENYEQELINYSKEFINSAIGIIDSFPYNYAPEDKFERTLIYKNLMINSFDKKSESKEETESFNQQLIEIVGKFPDEMLTTFINCSLMISNAINILKYNHPQIDYDGFLSDLPFNVEKKDEFNKMLMLGKLHKEGINIEQIVDPFGLFTPKLPYYHMINTFLGPEATKWIIAPSKNLPGKVQPHEISRINWHRLKNMQAQIEIENEILKLKKLEPILSKIVVINLWVMKGLSTVMDPNIFVSETKAYISSVSDGNATISQGLKTHTFINYNPGSFIPILKLFKKLIDDTILEANDIMWIANSLVSIRNIKRRYTNIPTDDITHNKLFLSHKGTDAKKYLMEFLLENNSQGIFLDCLSLPYKMINRNFVFRNLVNSKKILIFNTKNFSKSVWCIKEERLAELLNQMGFLTFEKIDKVEKGAAIIQEELQTVKQAKGDNNKENKIEGLSWTVERILKDFDSFNGQKPNLYTLKEMVIQTDNFNRTIGFLDKQRQLSRSSKEKYTVKDVQTEIDFLFNGFFSYFSKEKIKHIKNERLLQIQEAYICATAQLIIAILSLNSTQYDKMEVRKYLNVNNKLCKWILNYRSKEYPTGFSNDLFKQLVEFVCICIALELTGLNYKAIEHNGIKQIIKSYGLYKDGLVLLDVRSYLNNNDPKLHLLVNMVFNYDIGTVGILQSAENKIHESIIDGYNLEVIPCVTFHKGMDSIFTEFS